MSQYLMTTSVTLESGGGAADQVVFAAVAATTQGQSMLTGADNLAYYDGNLLAFFKYWWNAESKILIEKMRLTIPQLRGVQFAANRSTTKFNGVEFETITETSATTTTYYANIGNFGEWVDLNLLIETADPGERFYLNWPAQSNIWADFRNVQAIYDGIYPKLQIEMLVNSPLAPEVT